MTPMESLNAQFKHLLPGLIGLTLSESGPEKVIGRLTARPEVCTIGGILHGGAVMALADTLGAVGAFLKLPPNARTTTLESKTNFLGAAPVGSTVVAECTAVHRGKITSVWQTAVRAESGKLLALITQTQLVISG